MEKIIPKIVFVDTSIFINCALEEVEDLDLGVLKEFENKITDGEIILIVPEIVKEETCKILEKKFLELENKIINNFTIPQKQGNKNKLSKLENKIIKKCEVDTREEIKQKYKDTKNLIDKIFSNKNVKIIPLSDDVVRLSLKRALLLKAPHTSNQNKAAYIKDRDCACFESILKSFKNNLKYKNFEFIICVDDIDYYQDGKKEKINKNLEQELQSKCKKISIYTNPLKMLNKEFNKNYTESDVKKFENAGQVFVGYPDIMYTSADRVYLGEVYSPHGLAPISITGTLQNYGIKFCPYCGKDISKYIKTDDGVSLNTYVSARLTLHNQQNKICCPYCGKSIDY